MNIQLSWMDELVGHGFQKNRKGIWRVYLPIYQVLIKFTPLEIQDNQWIGYMEFTSRYQQGQILPWLRACDLDWPHIEQAIREEIDKMYTWINSMHQEHEHFK